MVSGEAISTAASGTRRRWAARAMHVIFLDVDGVIDSKRRRNHLDSAKLELLVDAAQRTLKLSTFLLEIDLFSAKSSTS